MVTNAGAETVSATSSFSAGTIALTGAMRVSWLSQNPDDVVTFVEQFVACRPDDVVKLARSGADERHLFIWSGAFSSGWRELRALGLDIAGLRARAPRLPPALTQSGSRPR